MVRFRIAALLLGVTTLTACAASSANSVPPDPAAQLQAIPAPHPDKLRDVKGWENPYLIVRTDGVALLDVANHEEKVYRPQELPGVLAGLPASAWPYGRVVAVTIRPADESEKEKSELRQNRALVAGSLQELKIYVNWIKSSS